MAIFIVEELSENLDAGLTKSVRHILLNIQIIGKHYSDTIQNKLDDLLPGDFLTEVLQLGRYLCLVKIAGDKSRGNMLFFDLKNNDRLALNRFKSYVEPEYDIISETKFLTSFREMKSSYKEKYNEAELIVVNNY